MFRDLLTMLYQCLVELVEARPGIGISAFRRFLPAVSKQTFAMIFFDISPCIFTLYKSCTLVHWYTFVFPAFRAISPLFQILQASPQQSRYFPTI